MRGPLLGLSRDNFQIMLSMFFWASGGGLWFYIQPLYINSLGASPLQIGLVLSVAPVAMLFGFVPVGILADRYGRKRTMLGGYMAGSLAALLLALTHDWRDSIPGLLLYFGSACCLPAIHAYVAHAGEEKDLSCTFTVLCSAYTLGLVILTPVGGQLAEVANRAAVFGIAALLLFLTFQAIPILALSFFLRRTYNACRSLAMAQMGKVLNAGSVGLAFGIFNTTYNLSMVVAPYLDPWLYASRPELSFLISADLIVVMMASAFVLLDGHAG